LGNVLMALGRLDEAAASFRGAIALSPRLGLAHHNLGNAYQSLGKLDEAVGCYREALALGPGVAEVHNGLGTALKAQGKLDEAAASFRKALSLNPVLADAHNNLGNLSEERGALDEAAAKYRKALSINPRLAAAHYGLGNVLRQQGRLDEAIACFNRTLALDADHAEAYNGLAIALKQLGRLADATVCYQKALALAPERAEFHCNLGNVLHAQGRLAEAIAAYERALEINADLMLAHSGLGNVYSDQGRYDAAIVAGRRALALRPDDCAVRAGLIHALQQSCEWPDLDRHIQTLMQALQSAPPSSASPVSPFVFVAMPGTTALGQKRCAELYARRRVESLGSRLPPAGTPGRSDRIRLGYLSADFRAHPVFRLMADVLEGHDRSRFHVTAYSYGPNDGGPVRSRAERAVDRFHDIDGDTYEEAAARIRADGIDILVDLSGYTWHERSGILALRPAPIQVSYLGFPGTTGSPAVDYLIADRFVVPAESFPHYTEKVLWLPDSYVHLDRDRPRLPAPTRGDSGLPEAAVVLCCFNRPYKITPDVFDVWCRVLAAVPDSVLWLSAMGDYAETNLGREAGARGIDASRLIMAPRLDSWEAHLARLQCADLFLDTTPYNAHATCTDALRMGVPVITCAGESFASRVAGSLLASAGVPELITYNLDDYCSLVRELAANRKKLDRLREKIDSCRETSPVFDREKFIADLEHLYTGMIEAAGSRAGVRGEPRVMQ
jgi:predicted O-linked N-acetylglucosamine transferase (SPINDLY family)